uniref:Major facilitator superfamily (MFS) profile domain-containing protein n=1 Tax=Panagrolaimus sp. PS1159 TaxID=55785 RepID=A0AC35EZ62_9BILA
MVFKNILKSLSLKSKKLESINSKIIKEKSDTDWRSIYIATFVALISSIQGFSIIPILWPYIKFINPEISEIANGAFQGASALGNAIASIFSGYLVNKTSNTKPALIISRILAIFSTFIYFGIELNSKSAIYLMIAYQLLMGISFGFGNVYRTHIAMATKESERSKGYGLSNLSYSLGTILGPCKFFI